MNTDYSSRVARLCLAAFVSVFGIATIIASGGSGGADRDPEGNPLPPTAATWFKSFGGPNDDIAYSAIPTRDGGFAFAGMLNNNGHTGDLWLTKLDSLGDIQWQRAYGERPLLQDGLWALVGSSPAPRQGPDGAIWMLGAGRLDAAEQSREDLVVARLNADNSPAWARSFDSGAHPDFNFLFAGDEAVERPESVTPTADGGALVAAWSYVRIGLPEGSAAVLREVRYLWLLKLSSTGSVQWMRRVTDDQFLYAKKRPSSFIDEWDQERIVARELGNRDLLINVISRFSAQYCAECELVEFTSTRFLHLRSGGELVINQRTPIERITLPFEAHTRVGDYELPAALVLDANGDNNPEGYVLAGRGSDVGDAPVVGDITIAERAVTLLLQPSGFFSRFEFYDEWPDGAMFTAIEPKCAGGGCGFLLAGSTAPEGRCQRQPFIGEIDADLELVESYSLIAENQAQTCFNFVPQRMGVATPQDMPQARDVWLIGMGPPRGSNQRIEFGQINLRLIPGDETPQGLFEHVTLLAWEPSLSITPDNQALGVVFSGAGARTHTLVRTNLANEVTLSRALRISEHAASAVPSAYDAGFALAQAQDQGFFVLGETVSRDDLPTLVLWALRTDIDGRLLWQRRLPGLKRNASSQPNAISIADGFLFGGFNRDSGGPVVGKLGLDGEVAWLASLPAGGCDPCDLRIAVAPNGEIVAAGNAWTGKGLTPWLARISSAGVILSMQRYDFPDWSFDDVEVLGGGDVLIAGHRAEAASVWRFTAAGEPVWNRVYVVDTLEQGMNLGTADDAGIRIEPLGDGGFLLALGVLRGADENILLARANGEGVTQWERLIGARYREVMNEMRVLADGGVLLAGKSTSLGDRDEAWIARLGADGRVSTGCNANLADYAIQLGNTMELAPLRLRRAQLAVDELAQADPASVPTQAGEFLPTAGEVGVARQCSGSAAPENRPPAPARFTLTMTASGTLPGAITSSPAGISCGTVGGACSAGFDAQSIVSLRPDSQIIGRVASWEGCDTSQNGVCIVRMTGARTVRVMLSDDLPKFLTITSISGNGRVTDAAGLHCEGTAGGLSGTCSASYVKGSQVTAIAIPGPGQTFQGWGGDCVASAVPTRAVLSMDVDRACSAVFTGVPSGSPRLTIVPEALDGGNPVDPSTIGRVTSNVPGIDCGADCSEAYAQHSNVTVTAEVFPAMAAAWEFERFVCPGPIIPPDQLNSRSASIQMTGDVTCTARFRNTIKRLHVDITGEGTFVTGRVISDPQRLDCTADCDRPFEVNTLVTLRARPTTTGQFRTWQGCDVVAADPDPGAIPMPIGMAAPPICQVQMTTTRTVAVFFEPPAPSGDGDRTLTVGFSGPSSGEVLVLSIPDGIDCGISAGPCSHVFAVNTVVQLMAIPQPGTLFNGFVGCTRDDPDGSPLTHDCEVHMVDDRFIQVRLLRP